jgi:hypothetical protein
LKITTRIATLGALMLLMLAMAAPAFGQAGATLQGYSSEGGRIQDTVNQPTNGTGDGTGAGGVGAAQGTTPVAASTSGDDSSLPFTGLDVGLMAVAAAGLMGLGFGLRRLARAPQAS